MSPYIEGMCPRTLDLPSRAIGLSEWSTESDCARVAGATGKVLSAWHAPIEGLAWHDVSP